MDIVGMSKDKDMRIEEDDTMKDKIQLAEHFRDKRFKIGAEIGVYEGDYAEILCQTIPGLKYYGVDDWHFTEFPKRHIHKGKYESTTKRLASCDATLIKKTSMDALTDFADDYLDFVYIDAAHDFDNVVKDIMGWIKKVKKGGIVSGDDYSATGKSRGVGAAVDGYARGHSLKVNIADDSTCWWFDKKWNT